MEDWDIHGKDTLRSTYKTWANKNMGKAVRKMIDIYDGFFHIEL